MLRLESGLTSLFLLASRNSHYQQFEENSSIFSPLCSSLLTERQTASLPKLPNEAQVSPSGRASQAVTVRSRAWNPGKAVLSASTWQTSVSRLPCLCCFFSKPFNSFLRDTWCSLSDRAVFCLTLFPQP